MKTEKQTFKISLSNQGNYIFEFTPVISGKSRNKLSPNDIVFINKQVVDDFCEQAEPRSNGGILVRIETHIKNFYQYTKPMFGEAEAVMVMSQPSSAFGRQFINLEFDQADQLIGVTIEEDMCVDCYGNKQPGGFSRDFFTHQEEKPKVIFMAKDLIPQSPEMKLRFEQSPRRDMAKLEQQAVKQDHFQRDLQEGRVLRQGMIA